MLPSLCVSKTNKVIYGIEIALNAVHQPRTDKKLFFFDIRDGVELINKTILLSTPRAFVTYFRLLTLLLTSTVTSRIHRKTLRIATKPGKKAPGKKISFGKHQKVSQLMFFDPDIEWR